MTQKIKKSIAAISAVTTVLTSLLYFQGNILANAEEYDSNGFASDGTYQKADLTTDKYDIDNNGEFDDVYEISNAGQLYSFAEKVNNGEKSANAILTADIILNENVLKDDGTLNDGDFKGWTPIKSYNGTFDGQGHTISGLYRDSSSYQNYGLFGNLNEGSSVSNIVVTDSYIVTYSICAGGIAANNYGGTISNCSFSGFISAVKKLVVYVVGILEQ